MRFVFTALLAAVATGQIIELHEDQAKSVLVNQYTGRGRRAADKDPTLGDAIKQIATGTRQIAAGAGQAVGNAGKAAGKAVANAVDKAGDAVVDAGSRIAKGICGAANWDCGSDLKTVKQWEEFKEDVEDMPIEETLADNLEVCVSKCWWRNQGKDIIGQAFEEHNEKWEKSRKAWTFENYNLLATCKITNSCPIKESLYETKPIPCGECCDKIPTVVLIGAQKATESDAEYLVRRKKRLLTWKKTMGTCGRYMERQARKAAKEKAEKEAAE